MSIPQKEIDIVLSSIHKHPEYLNTAFVHKAYSTFKLNISPDPFSKDIINIAINALRHKIALSIIRIGDGEANILTYTKYPDTPELNQIAYKQIIAMQQDSFLVNKYWMLYLQEMMMGAILQADIIGVIGLWRPRKPTTHTIAEAFIKDHRGISGHWRAIDYLLKLASQDYLKQKTIASAHLYFSVLENLSDLVRSAKKILIISNRKTILGQLKKHYPNFQIDHINIGCDSEEIQRDPRFLFSLHKKLPTDMTACLCLIGAGPWSEIYCSWVKQRGGVAIDIGSGFDLLDGETTRPIHNMLNLNQANKYAL